MTQTPAAPAPQPTAPPRQDPPLDDAAARLSAALQGLDLTSADGRAGIGALLSEIERACPGAILKQAAGLELRALGWRRDAWRCDDGRSSNEPPRGER